MRPFSLAKVPPLVALGEPDLAVNSRVLRGPLPEDTVLS